ncbi:hypothetical protein P9112_005221 [Eukaryota sp. TZLM1-RC]
MKTYHNFINVPHSVSSELHIWHLEHSHVPIQVPSQPQVSVPTDTTPLELLSSASLSEEQRQFVTSSLNQLVTSVQNIPFAPSVKKTRGRPLGSRGTRRNPSAFEVPPVKRPRGRPRENC